MLFGQIDGRNPSIARDLGGLGFLGVDIAPQNAALGNAGVANPDGGFLQNPALLASQKGRLNVSLQYSPWLRALGIKEFHFMSLNASLRIDDKRSIGLTHQQFSSLLTEWFFDPVLPFHQLSPKLYYAQNQQNFKWGVSLGYLSAGLGTINVNNWKSEGITLSVGLTSKSYQLWGADWTFAGSLNDLGPRQLIQTGSSQTPLRYHYLPTTIKLGGQIKLARPKTPFRINYQFEQLLLPRDLAPINSGWAAPIQSIHDAAWGQNWQEWQYKLGFEWSEMALGERLALAFRLGWQYESPEHGDRHLLTSGLGLQAHRWSFDFAYWYPIKINQPLQNTLMFSLGYSLGND